MSYYDYGVRLGGAAACGARAADGFEVTMSGLKFKDEVRFSFSLTPSTTTCVSRQPRHEVVRAARRHRRDPQQRSSARARPREGQRRERSNTRAGSPRVISSSILSRDRNMPFSFTIGDGNVIPGWDEGVSTMKVGGRRTLLIPPVYGDQNIGEGLIPPNSELKFDVELIEVKAGALAGVTAGLERAGGSTGQLRREPLHVLRGTLGARDGGAGLPAGRQPLMKGGEPGMGNCTRGKHAT